MTLLLDNYDDEYLIGAYFRPTLIPYMVIKTTAWTGSLGSHGRPSLIVFVWS